MIRVRSVRAARLLRFAAVLFLLLAACGRGIAAQSAETRIQVLSRVEPTMAPQQPPRPFNAPPPFAGPVIVVDVAVAADGSVVDARCNRQGLWAVRAVEAVRNWRFAPSGAPVQTKVGINFARLPESGPAAPPVRVEGKKGPTRLDGFAAVYPNGFTPRPNAPDPLVEVTIDAAGLVVDAVSLDPIDELTTPALEAALYWRFQPEPHVARRSLRALVHFVTAPSFGPPRSEWFTPSAPAPAAGEPANRIVQPRRIHDVRPQYPAEAQTKRIQGTVLVEALIDGEGNVAAGRVIRSIPLLDQAALDAVRGWKFTPTYLNGQPVPVSMTVTVSFSLQ